ncbi:MAG: glycosyltransferase family 9 protein [Ilyomonas sp.]
MQNWSDCKNILVIRADNMGDLIMTGPAIRALKESFQCRITVLTSSMGKLITPFIKDIDDVLVYDLPWIKTKEPVKAEDVEKLVNELKAHRFDAAIIFTVYSQNPLPAAMLSFMAGVPKRLSYCRENPYHLLTDWIPEKEPYTFIQHQVKRDLQLVESIGASTNNQTLSLTISRDAVQTALQKLLDAGVDIDAPIIIFHAGVSETKREYPTDLWIETGKLIHQKTKHQILLTGAASEKKLADTIRSGIGSCAISVAGLLTIEDFIAVIQKAALVVSVNTGTVHIAAAMQTPVIVLYALTNPQHTPWHVPSKVLYYSVQEELKSRNEVVRYVSEEVMQKNIPYPQPETIVSAAEELLKKEISFSS